MRASKPGVHLVLTEMTPLMMTSDKNGREPFAIRLSVTGVYMDDHTILDENYHAELTIPLDGLGSFLGMITYYVSHWLTTHTSGGDCTDERHNG